MTVKELIEQLQTAVASGQNPDAEVMAWNHDGGSWQPVCGMELDTTAVHLFTGP